MPLNPRLQIISLDPLSATMFASAVYPCVIQFNCVENISYTGNTGKDTGKEKVKGTVKGTDVSTDSVGVGTDVNVRDRSVRTNDISSVNVAEMIGSERSDSKEVKEIKEGKDGNKEGNKDGTKDGNKEGKDGNKEGNKEQEGESAWVVDEFDYILKQNSKQNPSSNLSKRKIIPVKLMFKSGDDLRQDQLVMQMMTLMDSLLKKVNLNLKLLTYGILAIGQNNGIMEFVPEAYAISAILKEHKSISKFLRIHNPDMYGPYSTSAEAIDIFVRSCAASCVVSYILGVGDRHLDNIMMKSNGQIFHIDYGYSFFQDPKPVQPPPFRFTHHMLDVMGGEESEYYEKFKSYCCQAFNWLRKSANLILNLLSLMGDAGITDISKRSLFHIY